jgi:CheY-like chemotaxis protein
VESGSDVGVYTIGAVSKLTGIPVATLRHWEKTFGVVVPTRTGGGHRLYSHADVDHLRWLRARTDEGLAAGTAHRLLAAELAGGGGGEPPVQRRGTASILILVAERDPITAELEEYFLRDEGYEVHIVLDGRKALEAAESLRPDLIIVDVVLPGMSGLKVCRSLKANNRTATIPILVFSVLDVRERALGNGADAFLLKPLEQPVLIEMVRNVLTSAPTVYSRKDTP